MRGTFLAWRAREHRWKVYAALGLCLACGPQFTAWAHPLDEWKVRYSIPTNQSSPMFTAVAFGGGRFVTVGTAGGVATSTTGEEWAVQNSGTTASLQWAAYGNGKYVIVGLGGKILSSPNGTNWTTEVSGTTFDLNRVEFGNGLFLALGGDGTYTSTNGTDWAKHTLGFSANQRILAYQNGAFLTEKFPSKTNVISADGVVWAPRLSGTTQNLYTCGAGKGLFVEIDIHDDVFTSPDAAAWTKRGAVAQYRHSQIAYGNGCFVACGGGRLEYSMDTDVWRFTTNLTYGLPYAVAFGHGTFVGAHGRSIVQSAPVVYVEAPGENQLSIAGPEGRNYEIQDAHEVTGPWQSVTNVTFTTSPYLWQDPRPASSDRRFYRAVLLP